MMTEGENENEKNILSTLSIICLIPMLIIIFNKKYQTDSLLKVLIILTVLFLVVTILTPLKKENHN